MQGTSRLISTDSEGINNSPPYLSPPQQFHLGPLATPSVSNAAAAAALVAVLSDDRIDEPIHQNLDQPQDSVPSPNNQKTKKTAEKAKPKPEPIKIKIKTKLTNAFIASLAEEKSNEVVGKKPRASRAAKKQQESVELVGPQSPQPGSAGYELYQTLTKSPTEDIDSQSSLIGSIGSTLATPAACPAESCVIQCRSSDATTDQDTSQDSSLVAPPSEADVRLAAAMIDVDPSQEVISNTHGEEEPVIQELATRRRGRPKGTATVPKKRGNHKVALDVPTEVTVSPKRTNTRGKRGTNTVEDDIESLHSPPVAQISEPEVIPKKRRGFVEEIAPESPEKVSKVGRPRRAAAQVSTEENLKETEEPTVAVEEKVSKVGRPSRNKTNGAMLQVRIEFIHITVSSSTVA